MYHSNEEENKYGLVYAAVSSVNKIEKSQNRKNHL